jgi:uncharacterized protein
MADDFSHRYGPWALVTGASSGIGEQFAHALAARGLNLIVTARRSALLDALAGDLRQRHGVGVEVLELDLSHQDFLPALTAACADKDIGLVVSNAGFGLKGENHRQDPAQLTAMLNVNCHAPMILARYFAPQLIERGRGGLLITSSMEAFVAFPYSGAYSATKAFSRWLGESLWVELRPYGIDVMVLAPGATDTEALTLQGFDKKQMTGLMKPADVVREALDGLGKKPVVLTGWMNRMFIGFLNILPRRAAVRVAGKGMKMAMEQSRKVQGPLKPL